MLGHSSPFVQDSYTFKSFRFIYSLTFHAIPLFSLTWVGAKKGSKKISLAIFIIKLIIFFFFKQVFDALRTTMFISGMLCVFIGISLLAPDDTRGNESKDNTSSLDSIVSSDVPSEEDRLVTRTC